VHLALPSDIARSDERGGSFEAAAVVSSTAADPSALEAVAAAMTAARKPAVILGIDIDPVHDVAAVRRFVSALGVPVFATPKAKGIVPEDDPLFYGVCAGVSGDSAVVEFLGSAD